MRRSLLRPACWLAAAAVCLAAGPQAQGALGDIVEKVRGRVGSALLTEDQIVEPGAEVTLRASLRSGLRLSGVPGKRIQFHLAEQLLGEAVSDQDGNASLKWQAPAAPGDCVLRVRLMPDDQPEKPVGDTVLLLAVRKADTPIVVVDLDKTLVASGFAWVLLGGAKPMDGADVVMRRLAKNHTIVYLTHRPDFLGPSSRKWLDDNAFPRGPILTSTMGGLASGSGTYKTGRLDLLKRTYKNLVVGIGDKSSDAKAYADNGLRSILILHVDWSKDDPEAYEKLAAELAALPETVQVVTNWSQVASILFEKAACPKREMEKRLRQVADDLRRRGKD